MNTLFGNFKAKIQTYKNLVLNFVDGALPQYLNDVTLR